MCIARRAIANSVADRGPNGVIKDMWYIALVVLFFFSDPPRTSALDEVNAVRAQHGLPAFIEDPCLTAGAKQVAEHRAVYLCEGHTLNDFGGLPIGCRADAAGCAAWYPNQGWGACCTYDHFKYAGAAYAMGRDGRRYMQLFVRGGSGRRSGVTTIVPGSYREGPVVSTVN